MTQHAIIVQSAEDPDGVATLAAARIAAAATAAIAARGAFTLVLAGGRTPLATYRRLAAQTADWQQWHIFFGDERCLPPDHPDRNSLAAAQALLALTPIPPAHWHPLPAELGAAQAARDYTALIRPRLPFDLVVLGMGEDGHTASLFPGQDWPEDQLVVPVQDAPKPPPERVSLTPAALGQTRALLVLVTGAAKADALAAWRRGADLPVARVAGRAPTLVLTDRAAEGA